MGRISPEKLEAMRSISVLPRGLPSKPRVKEWTDPVSGRMKATTDENGATITQHAKGDRQDVNIRVQKPVRAKSAGATPGA